MKDKTLLGLNLSVFLMMIGVGMIVALLPQRIIELDGNSSNVGYLASMFAIAYIVLQVPVGTMADKYGFKRFLALGYFLCFLTGLCYYLSTESTMIFLSRLLQGAGEAPVWALAPAMLSIKFASTKGSVMGAYNAVIHLGLTLGPILGVFLIKIIAREKLFLIYAFACLIGTILVVWLVDDVHPEKGEEAGAGGSFKLSNIIAMIKNSSVFVALIGITLYGTGYGIFLTTMPAYLIEGKNFDSTYIGIFFSLFYIAISISQLVTGKLCDRFGAKVFMVVGLLLASLGLGASQLFSSAIEMLAALTISSIGLGVFYLSSMIFLNDTVDDSYKGTVSGAYYLFWGIGMFFGPPLLSLSSKKYNADFSLICYAIIYLVLSFVMIMKFKTQHRK